MTSYRFDLYPRTNPLGTLILSMVPEITDGVVTGGLQKAAYRAEANGTSTGQLAVRSSTVAGQAIDPLGLQYVRVTELPGGIVRGGFFLEKGKFSALSEDEDHLLTFSGAGTLSYLSRASMAPFTYLSNDIDAGLGSFDDAMDPFDDTWRLYAQGFGNTLGAMLWRVVREAMLAPSGAYSHRHIATGDVTVAHDADRPESAIPAVTLTFDYTQDSSGNPWTLTSGEFKAQVGENLLTVVKRLMEAGLYVELDPDTFELRAWEQDTHRAMLDATGAAWAADVVRFQSPTDPDDLSTGNIKDDAHRNIEAHIKRSALWAGGSDIYGLATSPSDIPWEGYYRAPLGDAAAQEGIAEVQLQAIAEAGDTLKLRLWMEDDPANGRYLPWDHVLLDQQVTVHTGTDQWEFDERTFPVAALTVELKQGGNWDCIVELGASYSASASRQFQVQGVGAHTHPPNPELCPMDAGPIETDTTWKALNIIGASPPDGWNVVGYDDTDWTAVQMHPAAGAYVMPMGTDSLGRLIPSDKILLRKVVYIEPEDISGADVTFHYALDNAGSIYVNGVAIVTLGPDFTNTAGHYTGNHATTLSRSTFRAGYNCIAIYANNDAAGSVGGTPPGVTSGAVYINIPTTNGQGTSKYAMRCSRHFHASEIDENTYGNVQAALDALSADTGTDDPTEATRSLHGRFIATIHRASDQRPYVLYSDDGITFRLGAEIYNNIARDPSIIHWDGKYWVVCTVGVTTFRLLSSLDLETWTAVATPTVDGAGTNTWAPEWIRHFDGTPYLHPSTGFPAITVNVSTDSEATFTVREIHPTNRAMTSWSSPVTLTGTGLPTKMIDASLYVDGSDYWLWFKEETNKRIEIAHSTTALTSGYSMLETGDWAGWFAAKSGSANSIEGPSLVRLDDGRWRLYFNENNGFSSIRAVYSETTDDWRTGTSTWTTQAVIVTDSLMSHGSVILVPSTYDHMRDPHAHADLLDSVVVDLDDLGDVEITIPEVDQQLQYVGGVWVNNHRRWEPVVTDPGTGPELVFDGTGDIVMTWADYA